MQKLPSNESSDYKIAIHNENNIVDIVVTVENSSNLIQHYLAPDNVCADSELDNNNVVESVKFACIFIVSNK